MIDLLFSRCCSSPNDRVTLVIDSYKFKKLSFLEFFVKFNLNPKHLIRTDLFGVGKVKVPIPITLLRLNSFLNFRSSAILISLITGQFLFSFGAHSDDQVKKETSVSFRKGTFNTFFLFSSDCKIFLLLVKIWP